MEPVLVEGNALPCVASPRTLPRGMKLLVSGDSRATVESLRSHFLQKRCEVDTAYTSDEIRKQLAVRSFDALVGGFLSNDEYALRIIEIIRRASDVRLLCLTKKNDPEFNIKALDLGADDCLASPTSFFELDARVLRLCRRNTGLRFRETKIVLSRGEALVEIDMSRQSVKKNGQSVSLTKMEYRILLHLALNREGLVSYADIERMLSHESGAAERHSVNAHIFNLRKKITPALSIRTVSGHGFMLSI